MDSSSPSSESFREPHAVLLSFPAQGHLNPILTLAKLLHSHGRFRVTLVNTEFNHRRLIRSSPTAAAAAGDAIQGFRLAAIPDGLPQTTTDEDATQDIPSICVSTRQHCPSFFRRFLTTLSPPATCVIADGGMGTSAVAAMELGIPAWLFCTHGGCGFWSYTNIKELVQRGYTPLKDESYLINGYLDTEIDFIAGMKGIRLRDVPTFIRTTKADDPMLQLLLKRADDASKCVGLIFNTFDALETDVLAAVRSKFSNLYTIGPLAPVQRLAVSPSSEASMIGSNLWKNDSECLNWLDEQKLGKVVYVNFGSITVLSAEELEEFALGLAASGYPTLWIIRPDSVRTGAAAARLLLENLVKQMEGRFKVVTWCDQEAVLAHPATGVFLTHCGWNSTVESLWEGVPMVCWPFFAEQVTNCRYICQVWGVGLEIEGEVKRKRVEKLMKDAMEGEEAAEMKKRAMQWKERARRAIEPAGSSSENLAKLFADMAEASKFLQANEAAITRS